MQVSIEVVVVGLTIAFGIGTLVALPKRGPLDHLNALKKIIKSKNKVFVRHNGAIAGLVVDEDDWHDPDIDENRRTMIVLGLDGKRHEEPKDYLDETTGQLESAVPIGLENRHGIVLTQIGNPDGSIHPILTGAHAAQIQRDSGQFTVLKRQVGKIMRKFRPMEENYHDLQEQLDIKDKDLKSMREELSDRRSADRSQKNQIEALAARATGAEAERDMLMERMEGMKQIHTDLVKDSEEVWKAKRDIGRVKSQAGEKGTSEKPPGKTGNEKPDEKKEKKP